MVVVAVCRFGYHSQDICTSSMRIRGSAVVGKTDNTSITVNKFEGIHTMFYVMSQIPRAWDVIEDRDHWRCFKMSRMLCRHILTKDA